MPTFDPNSPASPDGGTIYHLAQLVAAQGAFQRLTETANATEALTKLVYGPHATPTGGDEYTLDELAGVGCEGHIMPPEEPESVVVIDNAGVQPFVSGTLDLYLRRYVRPTEIDTTPKRNNLWLWFYDNVCGLSYELGTAAESLSLDCPRISSIQRIVEAEFGGFEEMASQGEYLFGQLRIHWGDVSSD